MTHTQHEARIASWQHEAPLWDVSDEARATMLAQRLAYEARRCERCGPTGLQGPKRIPTRLVKMPRKPR